MEKVVLDSDKEIETIYYRHVDMVYRICYLNLKNSADAEDAVQTVFEKLIKQKTFESAEHVKAWLIVTSVNLCKNRLRNWWNRVVPIDNTEEIPGNSDIEPDETLKQVLCLPQKYKAAIYLYYYEGYSCAEIAKMTGQKEATVFSHLSRGRSMLREKIHF